MLIPLAIVVAQEHEARRGPASAYETERDLSVRVGSDRWVFMVRHLKESIKTDDDWMDRYVAVCKNRHSIKVVGVPYGNFWMFSRPTVQSENPIISVRGHVGWGMHWDTMFYRIHGGRLQTMGRPPTANSNGPINWKGHPGYWIFDDYDWYTARDDKAYRVHWLLYRIDPKTGKLHYVRKWLAPHGRRVKDTVHLSDW